LVLIINFLLIELGFLNDLWKFDGENWIWMSGSDEVNKYGSYGSIKVPNPDNVPGVRYYSVSWIDSEKNLWLFGGYGHAATSTS